MLEVMICMAAGIVLGRLSKITNLRKAITFMVWLMLFFLGWEVGGDENVMSALPSIGLDAIALSLSGVAGSVVFAFLLWKNINKGKPKEVSRVATDSDNGENGKTVRNGILDSLTVLGFFAAGIILGIYGLSLGEGLVGKLSFWSLCALILMIGMSVGGNPDLIASLKTMNPRLALLPLATISGTFVGCLVIDIFLGYKASDALAVGSGFGYYSLSSLLISGSRGLELGIIALISNIIRETITLLGSPLIARVAGPLAPIAAGGATTADTTLPIIRSCSGEEFVLLSIFHGFLVDFSVPFLVSFFCVI